MTLTEMKRTALTETAKVVRSAYERPVLTQLFFELTDCCNMRCAHCGSRCESGGRNLQYQDIVSVLEQVREENPFIMLTGGEPMLHPEFFRIIKTLKDMGFQWGMTTNGSLMTESAAKKCNAAGMYSVSVSLDGPKKIHDAFRGKDGAYSAAMYGIRNLCRTGCEHVMVTTVLTHRTLPEVEKIFNLVNRLDIEEWRLMAVEPIGRAMDDPSMLFTPEDYRKLFVYIRQKRLEGVPVVYSCPHYLGAMEYEVRDWGFRCGAGLSIASVMADGSIGACLDIERTEKTVQGNIHEDKFMDVWHDRFEIFRKDLSEDTKGCNGCSQRNFCRGDSHHTYDHTVGIQRLCMKGVLF